MFRIWPIMQWLYLHVNNSNICQIPFLAYETFLSPLLSFDTCPFRNKHFSYESKSIFFAFYCTLFCIATMLCSYTYLMFILTLAKLSSQTKQLYYNWITWAFILTLKYSINIYQTIGKYNILITLIKFLLK